MDQTFKVFVEVHDEKGNISNRQEIVSHKLKDPEHIKDLGLNHLEQIDLLGH